MIRHIIANILVCISLLCQTRAEQSILDIKVLCVTSPGERIEIEGYEKQPAPFAITGYKECYLFIKKQSPYAQQPARSQVHKAAEEIANVVHQ